MARPDNADATRPVLAYVRTVVARDNPIGPTQAGQAFGVGPGMELSAAFFQDHVAPLADERLGRDRYAAALLGGGSEVLGLDTEMSADHDWGPRVTLFVEDEARAEAEQIAGELPGSFRGVTRKFGSEAGGAPWVHPFEVTTVTHYFHSWIEFHDSGEATLVDWLATPAMSFLGVTAGAVFHDGPGQLTVARQRANWYPDAIWRWLVACQWRRVGEEQAFIGRAAMAGDELGAAIIAARLVREAMRLAFLLESRYAPYSKWLGAAFATLGLAPGLTPRLAAGLDPEGPDALCDVFEILGAMTNERLGLDIDPERRPYYGRPMNVAPAGEFTDGALSTVTDPTLRRIPTDVGNVDMLFGTNNGGFPGARAAYDAIFASR